MFVFWVLFVCFLLFPSPPLHYNRVFKGPALGQQVWEEVSFFAFLGSRHWFLSYTVNTTQPPQPLVPISPRKLHHQLPCSPLLPLLPSFQYMQFLPFWQGQLGITWWILFPPSCPGFTARGFSCYWRATITKPELLILFPI